MTTPLVQEHRPAEKKRGASATQTSDANQWQQLVELLRKGIVRISHAVSGVDEQLDRRLKELRLAVRDNVEPRTLERLVTTVSKAVVTLDGKQRGANQRRRTSAKALLGALDILQPNAQLRKKRKVLAAYLGDVNADFSIFLRDYAELLTSAVTTQTQRPGDAGFFSRMLGKTNETETPDPEIVAVVERVRKTLLSLLDSIDTDETLDQTAKNLHNRLAEGMNPQGLPDLLEEVAELAKTASLLEQKNFQDFVENLAKQFNELQVIANTNAASACDSQAAREEFEQSLQAKTKAITSHLTKATNLTQLQKAIAKEVDDIGEALGRYHVGEDLRHQKFEASVGLLQSKLGEAHAECNDLYSEIQHLRTQSQLDALTGLPNRAGFMERAQQEYERTIRYENRLAVAIADIDNFKLINDRYGHPAGDTVITEVASLIAANLRKADYVCRYGGEEFVILLPETPLEKAQQVADKIRMAIGDCPFAFRDRRVQVTVSIGVAELETGQSVSDVVEKADVALYAAKSAGRNRVMASKTH